MQFETPDDYSSGVRSYFAFTALRSCFVLHSRSRTGTRITQITAAVKPPLYSQKPPCILGTLVTSR